MSTSVPFNTVKKTNQVVMVGEWKIPHLDWLVPGECLGDTLKSHQISIRSSSNHHYITIIKCHNASIKTYQNNIQIYSNIIIPSNSILKKINLPWACMLNASRARKRRCPAWSRGTGTGGQGLWRGHPSTRRIFFIRVYGWFKINSFYLSWE